MFDLLLKNFNLGHNFLTRRYRAFFVTRPFHGYHDFWPSDLDLAGWPIVKKLSWTMTFESEGLLIVAIYIWLPPASYVVFSDNSGFSVSDIEFSFAFWEYICHFYATAWIDVCLLSTLTFNYTPANKVLGYIGSPCLSVLLSFRLSTSWLGHNFLLPWLIWIIFHTIIVHDPRLCHDLDSRSYLQGQGHSAHIPKIRVRAVTPHCHVGSR